MTRAQSPSDANFGSCPLFSRSETHFEFWANVFTTHLRKHRRHICVRLLQADVEVEGAVVEVHLREVRHPLLDVVAGVAGEHLQLKSDLGVAHDDDGDDDGDDGDDDDLGVAQDDNGDDVGDDDLGVAHCLRHVSAVLHVLGEVEHAARSVAGDERLGLGLPLHGQGLRPEALHLLRQSLLLNVDSLHRSGRSSKELGVVIQARLEIVEIVEIVEI